MMYTHYCKYCRRIHILNGHKAYCPACSGKLTELNISYLRYVHMNKSERMALKAKCADEKGLQEVGITDKKSTSRPEYTPHLPASVW